MYIWKLYSYTATDIQFVHCIYYIQYDNDQYIQLCEFMVTVNDLLNARGIYLIFVLKGGSSNRYEAFIRRGCLFLI